MTINGFPVVSHSIAMSIKVVPGVPQAQPLILRIGSILIAVPPAGAVFYPAGSRNRQASVQNTFCDRFGALLGIPMVLIVLIIDKTTLYQECWGICVA